MQRYAIRFTRFAGRIVSALTSRRAARFYRNTAQTLVFLWNVFLLACHAAILMGALTRDLWEAFYVWAAPILSQVRVHNPWTTFCAWADEFVESSTDRPIAVTLQLAPAAAPIALLPPARERRRKPIITPRNDDRILITPAPKPVDMQPSTQPQPAKRKRGRPRKVA